MLQCGPERVCSHPLGLVAKLGYSLTQLIASIEFPGTGELHQQTNTFFALTLIRSAGLHFNLTEAGLLSGLPPVSLPCTVQMLEIVSVQPLF